MTHKPPNSPNSPAIGLIRYLGGLVLSGGDLDGEPMEVWPWESRFLRGAFRVAGDSGLSVARGNGKSALCAGVAAAVVDPLGPLHGRRRLVLCVASSFDQSRVVFEDVLHFLRQRYNLEDRLAWRKQDSANRAMLEHRASGARVRCIGSDPRRAHGLRPSLVLADEPAQWPPESSDQMLAALRTGLGKVPGGRLIALGTRPASETHWFAKLLRSAPYSQVHSAPVEDPPFQVRTWRKANPSLDFLPSLRARLEEERTDARRDPDALASFRALRLNQGTSDHSVAVLVDADSWRDQHSADGPGRGGHVLGIDLGASAAMSAAAAFFPDGRLDAFAVFPEIPDLRQRGLADGVGGRYLRMAERGELLTAGRRVSDVRALIGEALSRWGRPQAIVCDRWREAELREVLEAVRFPTAHLIVRGQGYKDGGQDVRDFRAAVLGDLVRPVDSLLLTSAMSEARTITDAAGNSKLSKSTQGGRRRRARDDAAAAAVLAVAVGFRQWHLKAGQPATRRRRSAVV